MQVNLLVDSGCLLFPNLWLAELSVCGLLIVLVDFYLERIRFTEKSHLTYWLRSGRKVTYSSHFLNFEDIAFHFVGKSGGVTKSQKIGWLHYCLYFVKSIWALQCFEDLKKYSCVPSNFNGPCFIKEWSYFNMELFIFSEMDVLWARRLTRYVRAPGSRTSRPSVCRSGRTSALTSALLLCATRWKAIDPCRMPPPWTSSGRSSCSPTWSDCCRICWCKTGWVVCTVLS